MAIVLKPKMHHGIRLISKEGFNSLLFREDSLTYAVITSGLYKSLKHTVILTTSVDGSTSEIARYQLAHGSTVTDEILHRMGQLSDGGGGHEAWFNGDTYLGFESPESGAYYDSFHGSQLEESLAALPILENTVFDMHSNELTLTFDTTGGTSIPPLTVLRGRPLGDYLIRDATGKTGYLFAGWTDTIGGTTPIADIDSYYLMSNKTFYAVWEENRITITFDFQSGTDGTESVSSLSGLTPQAITPPVRSGYTFLGYFSGTNYSGTQYVNNSGSFVRAVSSDITLHAAWGKNGSYRDGTISSGWMYVGGIGYPVPSGYVAYNSAGPFYTGSRSPEEYVYPYNPSAQTGWVMSNNYLGGDAYDTIYNVVTREINYSGC